MWWRLGLGEKEKKKRAETEGEVKMQILVEKEGKEDMKERKGLADGFVLKEEEMKQENTPNGMWSDLPRKAMVTRVDRTLFCLQNAIWLEFRVMV
jgi:hypothetical protein